MRTKIVLIVAIFLVILSNIIPVYAIDDYTTVKAKVIENQGVLEIKQEDGTTKKEQSTKIRILEGEFENEEYEMKYIISEDINNPSSNPELDEDEIILVSIEEKDGEITKINYKETKKQNYWLYVILAFLIILALIIAKKYAIRPLIGCIFTVLATLAGFLLAIEQNWNLIMVSSLISLLITIFLAIKVNGINKKTGVMISCSIVGTAISGILAYLVYDIMNLTNLNIKISNAFINIKGLFVSATILFGGVLSNIIVLSSLNIFNFLNKPYKTKSDNIIEGQRSLKL